MPLSTHLLQLLNDSEFLTGTALGKTLGVSRSAVHQHITKLRSSGLPIECVRGRGYRLAHGVVPLEAASIMKHLDEPTQVGLRNLYIEQNIDSTNEYLRRLSKPNLIHGAVCLAEAQTAGHGRHGNHWVASPYRNLMMSLGWVYESWPKSVTGLAIAVGMELIDSLAILGVDGLRIKWPNDIVYDNKKLGGILIDASGESTGPCSLVIGVGMNVQIAEHDGALIDQPWVDLVNDLGRYIDRNHLAASCITCLYRMLPDYGEMGFDRYRNRWQEVDILSGRKVSVTFRDGEAQLAGSVAGIDSSGGLRIRLPGGRETVCYHGEVSVRRQ